MSPPVPSVTALSDADRVQAAEYVLGTLDPDERERVRARMAVDPAFAGAVRLWERRLSPLHELAVPVAPPLTLWPAIAADLRAVRRAGRSPLAPGPAGPGQIGGVTRAAGAGPGRSGRPAERPGAGPVAALRRLFGLGTPSTRRPSRPAAGGAPPAARQKRPAAPAAIGPGVPPALRMPGAARLGDAIDDAVAAGLLPPARPLPGSSLQGSSPPGPPGHAVPAPHSPAPGSPALSAPAPGLAAPAQGPLDPASSSIHASAPPPRPRPPPEPLTPPPAFIFLEPEPPADAEPAAAPAPVEAGVSPETQPQEAPASGPAAEAQQASVAPIGVADGPSGAASGVHGAETGAGPAPAPAVPQDGENGLAAPDADGVAAAAPDAGSGAHLPVQPEPAGAATLPLASSEGAAAREAREEQRESATPLDSPGEDAPPSSDAGARVPDGAAGLLPRASVPEETPAGPAGAGGGLSQDHIGEAAALAAASETRAAAFPALPSAPPAGAGGESPAPGIAIPPSAPTAAGTRGDQEGAAPAAPTASVAEPPSADPDAQRGEEAAPLPRWAEAVASGAVSALPETAAEPPAVTPPRTARTGLAWRTAALVLGVIALTLGVFVIYREWFWPRDGQWVSVLQGEPLPAIAVRIDPDSGVMLLRSFAPAPPEGEVNRLWVSVPGRGTHLIGTFSAGFSGRVPELAALGRARLGTVELMVTRAPASAPPQVPQEGEGGNVVYRGRLAPE